MMRMILLKKSSNQLMDDCEKLGFKGKYIATEIYAGSIYPTGPVEAEGVMRTTEFGMAKYLIQSLVGHSALDIGAGPCHPHFTAFPHPQSLSRVTWPVQTIIPCQPTPSYYTWRNIATAMDDFYGAKYQVEFSDDTDIIHFTLKSGDNSQMMIAAWVQVPYEDTATERKTDIAIKDVQAGQAWVVDVFKGTEQKLDLTSVGADTVLKGMLIKDYPVLIKLDLV